MPEKKVLRLTCPVCETRLKVSEGIERFACLNCGAELKVDQAGGQANVSLTQASAARLTGSQQQLIEVNSEIKAADDSYGVGCAIATMGITLVACIILALAIVVQSQPLFWGAIAIALVLLGFVLFMFLTASSRGTDPLLRKRDRLQAEFDAEQVSGAAEDAAPPIVETGDFEPAVPGEEIPREQGLDTGPPAVVGEGKEPEVELSQPETKASSGEPLPPPEPKRSEPLG